MPAPAPAPAPGPQAEPEPGPGPAPRPNREYPPNGPTRKTEYQDNTYRDLCKSSRILKPGEFFDDITGELVLAGDGPNPAPDPTLEENFFAAQHVAGAKPGENCMPAKNTPVVDLKNTPFMWVNLKDASTGKELNDLARIYRWTGKDDTLKAYMQVVGGIDFCPQLLVPDKNFCLEGMTTNPQMLCGGVARPPDAPSSKCANMKVRDCDTKRLMEFRMAVVRKCAETYIAMRSMRPWWLYEKYGSTWEEFLAPTGAPWYGYGGHEAEPPVRMLQPLMRGSDARKVYKGEMKQRYARKVDTIRDGKHPWRNEWELDLGVELERYFKDTLIYGTALDQAASARIPKSLAMKVPKPFPDVNMPCIKDKGGLTVAPGVEPPRDSPAPAPAPAPEPVPEDNNPNPVPQAAPEPPVPGDPCKPKKPPQTCGSGSITHGGFCDPGDDEETKPPIPPAVPDPIEQTEEACGTPIYAIPGYEYKPPKVHEKQPDWCTPVEQFLMVDAWAPRSWVARGGNPHDRYLPPSSIDYDIADTDRHFSNKTSRYVNLQVPGTKICQRVLGYTTYQEWQNPEHKALDAIAMCAITPVDLMTFRFDVFNGCMGQRINFNYNTWVKWMKVPANFNAYTNWVEDYDMSRPPHENDACPFIPPCATRYYQTDDANVCKAAAWSVKQCCGFAAMPVTLVNQTKTRMQYGPRKAFENVADPDSPGYDSTKKYPLIAQNYMETYVATPFSWGTQWSGPGSNANEEDLKAVEKMHDIGWPAASYDIPRTPRDATFFYTFRILSGRSDPSNTSPNKIIGAYFPGTKYYDTGGVAGTSKDYVDMGIITPDQARGGVDYFNNAFTYDVTGIIGNEGRTKSEAEEAIKLAQGITNPRYTRPQFELDWLEQPQNSRMGGYGTIVNRVWDTIMNGRYNRMPAGGLPRYEVTFKDFDMDDFPLGLAGGQFNAPNGAVYQWPKGWRGYGSESFVNVTNGFPYVNNPGMAGVVPPLIVGGKVSLSQAQADDIIVVDIDGIPRTYFVVMKGNKPHPESIQGCIANPTLCYDMAYIQSTSTDFLIVKSMGINKVPSSTGIGSSWGRDSTQMLFSGPVTLLNDKVHKNPGLAEEGWYRWVTNNRIIGAFDKVGDYVPTHPNPHFLTPSCRDPDFLACTVPKSAWNNAIIFRPHSSVNDCARSGVCMDPFGNPQIVAMRDVPPGNTRCGASLVMSCYNDGKDPLPGKPWTLMGSWVQQRSGGYKGVGAGDYTLAGFCPAVFNRLIPDMTNPNCVRFGPNSPDCPKKMEVLNKGDPEGAWGSCPSARLGPNKKNTPLPSGPMNGGAAR